LSFCSCFSKNAKAESTPLSVLLSIPHRFKFRSSLGVCASQLELEVFLLAHNPEHRPDDWDELSIPPQEREESIASARASRHPANRYHNNQSRDGDRFSMRDGLIQSHFSSTPETQLCKLSSVSKMRDWPYVAYQREFGFVHDSSHSQLYFAPLRPV
jgi:hypothetical protein